MFYFSFSYKDLYEISLNDILKQTIIRKICEFLSPQFDSSFDEIISLVYLFYDEDGV